MCQPAHDLLSQVQETAKSPLSVFSLASLPREESLFIDYDIPWEVFADDLHLC